MLEGAQEPICVLSSRELGVEAPDPIGEATPHQQCPERIPFQRLSKTGVIPMTCSELT
jgi:hypothetical protein